MYLCICAGLTDSRLKRLLLEGKPLDTVQMETGAGRYCGKCRSTLEEAASDVSFDLPPGRIPETQTA